MRLINADALRQVLEVYSEKDSLGHTPVQLCDAMPTVDAEPKWILCSERLPSARQSVIISTTEWTGEGCYWETTEHHVIWKGYRWNATYWDDEVIAWMPLPESYKGEVKEDG